MTPCEGCRRRRERLLSVAERLEKRRADTVQAYRQRLRQIMRSRRQ